MTIIDGSDMPKEKIIILGHSGFVGKHLYRELQKEPTFEVYGFSTEDINLLNLGTYQKLADICDGETTIIMAATNKTNDLSALNSNIKMTLNLANFLSSTKVKHLIYTGSVSIYGNSSKTPITENSPANPDSFYSSAKTCAELILKRICEELDIAFTNLRIGKIYGKGDITSPIYIFSQNIISGKPIEIYGNGSHRLYLVHQDDLLSIIKKVILKEISGDYNITTDSGITLLEIARLLFELSGRKVEIKFKRAADSPILLTFNASKLRATFGNFPSISLEEGLKEYFASIIP